MLFARGTCCQLQCEESEDQDDLLVVFWIVLAPDLGQLTVAFKRRDIDAIFHKSLTGFVGFVALPSHSSTLACRPWHVVPTFAFAWLAEAGLQCPFAQHQGPWLAWGRGSRRSPRRQLFVCGLMVKFSAV